MTARIFAAIAAYRDPDVWETIDSMLDAADGSVRVAVVNQDCPLQPGWEAPDNVHVLDIKHEQAWGVGWARALANSFYRDEAFWLQVDSHMLFRDGWDTAFIRDLDYIGEDRAVLSSFPAGYPMDKDTLDGRQIVVQDRYFSGWLCHGSYEHRLGDRATGKPEVTRGWIYGSQVFAPARFLFEVPHDPTISFYTEEESLAVRAWTRGWDIWSPTEAQIMHREDRDRDGREAPRRKFSDDPGFTSALCEITDERIKRIRKGEDFGIYGPGTVRTMQEYAETMGLDFEAQTVSENWTPYRSLA